MGIFTAIGTWLGATAAAAFGTGVLATGVAAGAVGTTITATQATKAAKKAGDVSMPQAPQVQEAAKLAQVDATARRKAMARTGTVKTSPLGIAGEAQVARKTLLGQ